MNFNWLPGHRSSELDVPDPATDVPSAPAAPGYDAQADLALLDVPGAGTDSAGFAPFAGSLSPDLPAAGYDAERDTGTAP